MGDNQSYPLHRKLQKLSSREIVKYPSEHLYLCSDVYMKNDIQMSFFMNQEYEFTRPGQASLFILGLHQSLNSVVGAEELLQQLSDCKFYPIKALLKKRYGDDMDFSFSRHLVPLTMALTRYNWKDCAMQKQVTELYGLVKSVDNHFFSTYLNCLRKAVREPIQPADQEEDGDFSPVHHLQLLFPIVLLVLTLVTRNIMDKYDELVQNRVAAMEDVFEEILKNGTDNSNVGTALQTLNEHLGRLKLLTKEARLRLDRGLQLVEAAEKHKKDVRVPDDLWPIPPRFISQHDNDHEDIKKIHIPPSPQEILVSNPVNLPGNYPLVVNAHWKPQGAERHLDTHFRLLREDFISPIRNSILLFLKEVQLNKSGSSLLRNGRLSRKDFLRGNTNKNNTEFVNLFIYKSVQVLSMTANRYDGLVVTARFDQVVKLGSKKRREFWASNQRLSIGTLVCFVQVKANMQNQIVFATVRRKDEKLLAKKEKCAEMSFVPVHVQDAPILQSWMEDQQESPVYMLEICKVIYDAITPVCFALQSWDPSQLPLSRYICPTSDFVGKDISIAIPRFANSNSFYYDLSSMTGNEECRLYPSVEASRRKCVADLQARSKLDNEQSEAFVYALCSEISCTQGPPGTGKTFLAVPIVTTLLENQNRIGRPSNGRKSPILLVCYTNHALDQFLNHLIHAGVSNIVRIGGRCTDPSLEPYCFKSGKIRKEAYWKIKQQIEAIERDIQHHIRKLQAKVAWNDLKYYLHITDPDALDAFLNHPQYYTIGKDHEWQAVGKKGSKNIKDILTYWLSIETSEDLQRESRLDQPGLWRLTLAQRRSRYEEWVSRIQAETRSQLSKACKQAELVKKKYQREKELQDFLDLSNCKVIGMTTTGAAKHQHLLSSLQIKTVMLEEAAEVLEGHVLSCLSPNTQQLIMIGDHLQLRPQINTYNLSMDSFEGKKHALNLSMFERLQAPDYRFPTVTLKVQRRMRPAISKHIRNILYPDLRDGENVLDYPDVRGMKHNVFFFNHDHAEDALQKRDEDKNSAQINSHSNHFEAIMAASLVQYLIQQGYEASDIVVLTPYISQLMALRKALEKYHTVKVDNRDQEDIMKNVEDEGALEKMMEDLQGTTAHKSNLRKSIRVATVDNFQGEEATIVVLSLVRNSGQASGQTIGFLKNANRINVMLSRAKHGLYILGQALLFSRLSPTWDKILQQMTEDGCVGRKFSVYCQKHPEDVRYIGSPADFDTKTIGGGCGRPCTVKLKKCGHLCPRPCHSDLSTHTEEICVKPCQRMLPCQHPCPRVCSQRCGQCPVNRGDITLPCGHVYESMPCHLFVNLASYKCQVMCEKVIPSCGHSVKVRCCEDPEKMRCRLSCGQALPCGHNCAAECSECTELSRSIILPDAGVPIIRTKHLDCNIRCGRQLSCGHSCEEECHSLVKKECAPCKKLCTLSVCNHSVCDHLCATPCIACAEPCEWECVHEGRCLMPCGIPCTRLPCNERCALRLSCGHQCPSLCGEPCPRPEFCKEDSCAKKLPNQKILDQQADLILMRSYREINVEEDPIIVLPCGHLFTVDTLDGLLNFEAYYTMDKRGKWTGLKEISTSFMPQVQCPSCRDNRIRLVRRYGRAAKHACNYAAEKKFIVANSKIIELIRTMMNTFEKQTCDHMQMQKYKKTEQLILMFQESLRASPLLAAYESMQVAISKGASINPNERNRVPVHTSFAVPAHLCLARLLYIRVDQYFRGYGEISPYNNGSSKWSTEERTKIETDLSRAAEECEMAVTVAEKGNAHTRMLEAKFMMLEGYKRKVLYCTFSCQDVRSISSVEKAYALCQELQKLAKEFPSFANSYQDSLNSMERFFRLASKGIVEGYMSESEKSMVRAAMDREFFYGGTHWYQCPNGHPYTIGECGGAMQLTQCPECGENIGGQSHNLASRNQVIHSYGQ
ncbi:hypothetical protein EC973_009598 [Apophysomyces ossiformis]|uniref:RZ-type domain-containing protein n=1 Tax=Apophysomyces ossiformis TaxID=679940 RepID=A0A8H7BJL1_9FUNG|nr:hypothetical protein EC973_009598 [Apophysomyces ossiformis]